MSARTTATATTRPNRPFPTFTHGGRYDANPYLDVQALDINKANKQIAHGITRVLRPSNL